MHFSAAAAAVPLLLEGDFLIAQTEHFPHFPLGWSAWRALATSWSFCFMVNVNFGLTFSHGGSIALAMS
jgi:hypothetical protein